MEYQVDLARIPHLDRLANFETWSHVCVPSLARKEARCLRSSGDF